MPKPKKFKSVEKNAKIPNAALASDIEWQGEEIAAEATTKLSDDTGTGQAVVLRFFDFGANPEAFKKHKPTAQELFNSHLRGMEAMLWKDGLKVFTDTTPRLMFSKDNKNYRFIIACVPAKGHLMNERPQTLTELLTTK